ncbi:MAG: serine/threonine-protein kinase [Polyangiales bacterium]
MSERETLDPDEGYLKPGDVVADRFEVTELLGEGGMGAVYRAVQRGLKREVALKIIRPDKTRRASARERFLREARVASLLRHPGVVGIFDFGEQGEGGGLYLAMELLNGPALREVVDEDLPLLSWSRVLEIGAAIADVLDAADGVGLVHRDSSPRTRSSCTATPATTNAWSWSTRPRVRRGRRRRASPHDAKCSREPPSMSLEQCRGSPGSDRPRTSTRSA